MCQIVAGKKVREKETDCQIIHNWWQARGSSNTWSSPFSFTVSTALAQLPAKIGSNVLLSWRYYDQNPAIFYFTWPEVSGGDGAK
jgi:hypothetical protein